MKSKVLAMLKPILASKGFNKEELEGLAEIAAKNLTEASTSEEIDNVVNGIIPYADLMQRVGNRMVTSVESKYKGWIDPSKVEPPKQEPPKEEPKGLTADEIQKLISEGIAAGLKPYQEREEKQRLHTLLNSHDKVKTIPEAFRNKYVVEREEDIDNVATQMEADFAQVKQALVTSGEFVTPPTSGGGASETDDLINMLHAMGEKAMK